MHHIVYETTNLVNGKIYVGSHRTDNPNDDYFGSGTVFKSALAKYGNHNFVRKILADFDNSRAMYAFEGQIVNADFIASLNTYNIKLGGQGGWDFINSRNLRTPIKILNDARIHKILTDKEYRARHIAASSIGGKKTVDQKLGIFANTDKRKEWQKLAVEKSCSDKAKEKRKNTFRQNLHQQGSTNSQFGTCWITKDGLNKKIKKSDLDVWTSDGWEKGRSVKS